MKILNHATDGDYKNYNWLRQIGLYETSAIHYISRHIKFQDDLNLVIDTLKGVKANEKF